MEKIKTYQIIFLSLCIIILVGFVIFYALFGDVIPTIETTSNISTEGEIPVTSIEGDLQSSDIQSNSLQDDTTSQQIDGTGMQTPVEPNGNITMPPAFTEEDIQQIDEVIQKYGEGISVYYQDINSGNTYLYNEEEKYFIASVIKAPYCMYLYQLASDGKLDLSKTLTVEEKDKQEGMGKIKGMVLPVDLSISELIKYAIIESDNTAMTVLLKSYPHTGYQEYATSLGLNYPQDVKYVVNGDICAKDSGVYLNAMYDFLETNQYGNDLKQLMMSTRTPLIATKYPIARKYGWADLSFHDFGVIYAPNPYLLCILTNHDEGKEEDYRLFKDITSIIEKLQNDKYQLVAS